MGGIGSFPYYICAVFMNTKGENPKDHGIKQELVSS